jgi:adenylate kinase family enzyme
MYKRIIILGGSGSGKSTLARRISEYTGYPVYHLDVLTFDKNRQRKNPADCNIVFNQFLSKDIGIVDGNFTSTLLPRINWSDLIIFIDIPNYLQAFNFFVRNFKYFFKIDRGYGRPDGTKQNFMKELILCIQWNKNHRKRIFSMLELAKDKKVVIIKEPRKLDIKSLLE